MDTGTGGREGLAAYIRDEVDTIIKFVNLDSIKLLNVDFNTTDEDRSV